MARVRVLVVEDDRFTRAMLQTVLSAQGFDVVAACERASQALAAQSAGVDVALLDLDLGPGPSGIDVAYALRARQRDIGLVFLTSFSDPRVKDPSGRPLPVGSRFLVKSRLDDTDLLRSAVLDAQRTPLRAERATIERQRLTMNQLEVLRLVAAGSSNASIAEEHGISEKAIERTLARIIEALEIDRDAGNTRVLLARAYAELAGKPFPAE